MTKKVFFLFAFLLAFSTLFTLNTSKASELNDSDLNQISIPSTGVKSEVINNPGTNVIEQITEDQNVSPAFVNDFRSRKKNVTYSESWSGYKRISDNLNTYNSSSGSITATKTASFGVTVSGSIQGLGISSAKTLTSTKSYTLNVPKNKIVYMGYKVRYKVENGTREYYDVTTGKVISSNKYTVKTPIFGEHKLVTAN